MTTQAKIQNLPAQKSNNAKGKENVTVKEYRNKINFAFDSINSHWCACHGKTEKVSWFVAAILRFSELELIECKRAKPEDHAYYKQAFRLFNEHCQKHFVLWLDARAELEISYAEEIK